MGLIPQKSAKLRNFEQDAHLKYGRIEPQLKQAGGPKDIAHEVDKSKERCYPSQWIQMTRTRATLLQTYI